MEEQELTSSNTVHLPTIAIQRILSYLPPDDAIRASSVSRQWRSAWISSPTLVFDEKPCPIKGSDFFDYVDGLIALWRDRCDARVNLERLSLSAVIDAENLADRFHSVVAFAAERNVKSVELANQASSFWLALSSDAIWNLLFSDCKSLSALSLKGFNFLIGNPFPIKSFSVKKLSLSCNAFFNDVTLRNLIDCFPSLEELYLGFFPGLNRIQIMSPSLKKFEIIFSEDKPDSLQIESQSLESFIYARSFRPPGIIRFLNCKSLTSLMFDQAVFNPDSANTRVVDYISQIPLLEELSFQNCQFVGRIDILHSYLKRLNLKSSYGFKRAVIDTPNLHFFKYFGGVFHFESFKYRSGFLKPELGLLTCSFDDTQWFWLVQLRNFLENFSKCNIMALDLYIEGFPEEIRDNDFLPDPFNTMMHLNLTNRNLALQDCIHFVGAMLELFPSAEILSIKTPFAIISIKYDDTGSFTLSWVPTVGASNTEKYGVKYQYIIEVLDELVEFLSWSGDDIDQNENEEEEEMDVDKNRVEDEDEGDMDEDKIKDDHENNTQDMM